MEINIVALTEDDIRKIKKENWFDFLTLFVFVFFSIFCTISIYNSTTEFYRKTDILYNIGLAVINIFLLAIPLGIAYFALKKRKNMYQDLLFGEKLVIVGLLTQKEIERKIKYFYVDDEKFVVGWDFYEKFKEGQKIALHIAPKSRIVLKIEKADV